MSGPASYQWRDPPALQGVDLMAPYRNAPGERSADSLRKVIAQFDVENSPRYLKNTRGGGTWCNRFVCDVLHAMGVGIPYQRATAMHEWFKKHSFALGWRSVGPKVAMFEASMGRPVVATWPNPDTTKSGHVAIVVPARGAPGLWIAQAGLSNFSHGLESRGFGSNKSVSYWSHD